MSGPTAPRSGAQPAGEPTAAPAAALTHADAARLEECVAGGGVAVFPTDTVYGVGCDPEDARAARRLYELKGRPPDRPAAVMFFALQGALGALPELGEAERGALLALLPGPVTVLLPNRERRFPLACAAGSGAGERLGLRVPALGPALAALEAFEPALLQSSANLSGGADARTLAEVPGELRRGADLVLDGGRLAGVASTVVDLLEYGSSGRWRVVREGALPADAVARALGRRSC